MFYQARDLAQHADHPQGSTRLTAPTLRLIQAPPLLLRHPDTRLRLLPPVYNHRLDPTLRVNPDNHRLRMDSCHPDSASSNRQKTPFNRSPADAKTSNQSLFITAVINLPHLPHPDKAITRLHQQANPRNTLPAAAADADALARNMSVISPMRTAWSQNVS